MISVAGVTFDFFNMGCYFLKGCYKWMGCYNQIGPYYSASMHGIASHTGQIMCAKTPVFLEDLYLLPQVLVLVTHQRHERCPMQQRIRDLARLFKDRLFMAHADIITH